MMDSPDDFRKVFLNEIQEISPLVEDYIAAELFELEIEYSDGIDDSVLFNLVLNMVIGELTTLGIEIIGGTDIYNDQRKVELIKALRKEFDIRNFKRLLTRSEDFKHMVASASYEWDDENIVHTVAEIANDLFPTSTTWEFILNNSIDCVVSSHSLSRHVTRLIEIVDDGTYSDTREDELITQYTQAISVQRSRFIRNVDIIRPDLLEIENVVKHEVNIILDKAVLTYDIDLINNMHPDYIPIYLNPEDPHPAYRADGSEDIRLVNHHKRIHSHHVECLEIRKTITGDLATDAPYLAMLVADGYRETWDDEKNLNYFNEYTEPLHLSEIARTTTERWFSMVSR